MASLPTLLRRLEALETSRTRSRGTVHLFDGWEGCLDPAMIDKAKAEGRKAVIYKWLPVVESVNANRI